MSLTHSRKENKNLTLSDLYHVSVQTNNNLNRVHENVKKKLGNKLNGSDKKFVDLEECLLGENATYVDRQISLNEVEKYMALEDKLLSSHEKGI